MEGRHEVFLKVRHRRGGRGEEKQEAESQGEPRHHWGDRHHHWKYFKYLIYIKIFKYSNILNISQNYYSRKGLRTPIPHINGVEILSD